MRAGIILSDISLYIQFEKCMASGSEECAEAAFVTGGNCGFMSAENYFCTLFCIQAPKGKCQRS